MRAVQKRVVVRSVLASVLLLAAYLRLSRIDLTWFMNDQARDATMALGIVRGQSFPMLGTELHGGPAHTWGPLYFYLLAIPFALSPDPSVAVGFLSLLNLASVYLTYRFGKSFFGTEVGVLAAALFAVYPLAVISARGLWNVAPLPLFTLGFFWALSSLIVGRRPLMVVPALATLACLVQLHLSSASLFIVLGTALLVFRPPVRLAHLLWGMAAFLLLLLPYLYAQGTSGFQDLRALFALREGHVGLPSLDDIFRLVRRAFFILPGLSSQVPPGYGEGELGRIFRIVHWTEGWLLLIGAGAVLGLALARRVRATSPLRPSRAAVDLLALWLWLPLVLLAAKKDFFKWYYLDLWYPAQFLAGSLLLSDLLNRVTAAPRPTWVLLVMRGCVYGMVGIVVTSNIDFLERLWKAEASAGTIQVPPAILGFSAPASAPTLEIMPVRFKRRLVRSLVEEFRVDREGLYRRVHGAPIHDLLEDKGFFFEWLSSRPPGGSDQTNRSGSHYAVLNGTPDDRLRRGQRVKRVGPFIIASYIPFVDYGSWKYSYEPEPPWLLGRHEGSGSRPLRIPTEGMPDLSVYEYASRFTWEKMPVSCWGEIFVPIVPAKLPLVVSLQDLGDHHVETFYVNGKALAPDRSLSYSTLAFANKEVVFDLADHLLQGRNIIAFRVSGRGLAFDLDVYEIPE